MSRARRGGTGALHPPIWPCSAWGLPCPRRCRRSGALLPHRFTLTVRLQRSPEGGLFSVALSFALPRPGVTRHAARVEFGLSSPIARGDRVARSDRKELYQGGGGVGAKGERRKAKGAGERKSVNRSGFVRRKSNAPSPRH